MSESGKRDIEILEEYERRFQILESRVDVGEVKGKVDELSKRVDDLRKTVDLLLKVMLPILAMINGLAIFLTKAIG